MGCEAHTFFPWNLIGSLNKLTTLARLRFNLTAEADIVEYILRHVRSVMFFRTFTCLGLSELTRRG